VNVEELVRGALRDQAAEQAPAAPGFADRVLAARRRRSVRRFASVAAATAAVVAVAVAVPVLDTRKDDVHPAGVLDRQDIHAHPDQSPPRDLIAAGKSALAAYYTTKTVVRSEKEGVSSRTYWLLDPRTGRYVKDARWSVVAVAPGLRTAAVLERELPAERIGLLDLTTGEVERWIPVEHGVGGLAFSRDGSRLVATTYDEHPDLLEKLTRGDGDAKDTSGKEVGLWAWRFGNASRTGFYVVDVASGEDSWSPVERRRDINARQDFAFSRDGRTVYSQVIGGRDGLQQFYDLAGKEVAAPANERYLRSHVSARLSPGGRLAAVGLEAEAKDKSWSAILDPRTGKKIANVRGAELLAWADDKRLIAWERTPGQEAYRPRLVLVTIGSDKVVPLSGVREPDKTPDVQGWQPVFAER
jgi:hypothetical protein